MSSVQYCLIWKQAIIVDCIQLLAGIVIRVNYRGYWGGVCGSAHYLESSVEWPNKPFSSRYITWKAILLSWLHLLPISVV